MAKTLSGIWSLVMQIYKVKEVGFYKNALRHKEGLSGSPEETMRNFCEQDKNRQEITVQKCLRKGRKRGCRN
jgi:hypothetical protein